MSELISAAKNGYYNQLLTLLGSGNSISTRDKDNATALYWGACRGHRKICEALLQSQCEINARVNWGSTALHAAADRGHVECVKLLVHWGANINIQNNRGDTPLHLSAYRGFLEIIEILKRANADPFIKNDLSKTPLQEAQSQQYTLAASILQQYMNNMQQFSSLPNVKQIPLLMDADDNGAPISWPQTSNRQPEFAYIPNITNDGQNSFSSNKSGTVDRPHLKISPSHGLCTVGSSLQSFRTRMEPQENMDEMPHVSNYNPILLNGKENFDVIDGPPIGGHVSHRSCIERVPMQNYSNGIDGKAACLQETNRNVNVRPGTHRTALENFAESLQIELVKYHELTSKLEKEKSVLTQKCEGLEKQLKKVIHSHNETEQEVQRLKAHLLKVRQFQKQAMLNNQFFDMDQDMALNQQAQHKITNMQPDGSACGQTSINVSHQHLQKLLQSLSQNDGKCNMDGMLCSMKKQLQELWLLSPDPVKLDIDNREWIMGKDFEIIGDRPINHFPDGQRDGSCSLVFQIRHKGQQYILKMMINLINLHFDSHNQGYSMDGHLIRNFGMEYHVPLLLAKHLNIIQVLHHFQGSTDNFRKYENLLVPRNFDVPIEMAHRTTFLVLKTYPQTLRSFIVKQRTRWPEPCYGLSDVFLLHLLYQLLAVVDVLQKNQIVHRDIKGDNVFLDKCLRPVLGDFGFARSFRSHDGTELRFVDKCQASAGNPHAWAPELSRYHRCGPNSLPHLTSLQEIYAKSDVFAIGRMFYSFLCPLGDDESFPQSSVNQPHYPDSAVPEIPCQFSCGLRHILKQLVLDNPAERPTPRKAMLSASMLLFSPRPNEVTCHSDVMTYCQSRMLKLLAVDGRNIPAPTNVLTTEESLSVVSHEIEASFLVNVAPEEFWEIYQDLKQRQLLAS